MENNSFEKLTQNYISAYSRERGDLLIGETRIPLKDVYVMLEAVEKTPPQSSETHSDIVETPSRQAHAGISDEKISIEENVEQGTTLDSISIRADKVATDKKHQPNQPVPLSKILNVANHIVLLGEPGAGKSTTLQFIGLCFTEENWKKQHLNLLDVRIPVYLDLKLFAERLGQTDASLKQVIVSEISKILVINPEQANSLFEFWLYDGKLLLLLDGLDEVIELRRQDVLLQLTRFSNSPLGKESRIIITSRIAGYAPVGANFRDFIIKPFENESEILPYIQGWFSALRPEWNLEHVSRSSQALLSDLENKPVLNRIIDNPLLLRLTIEVYAQFGQLVNNRVQLYKKWLDTLWQRGLARGANQEQKEKIFENLENVAWCIHNSIDPPKEIDLDVLRSKLGVVIRVGDKLTFSHLTIQEYFVAKHLLSLWHKNPKSTWLFLQPRLYLSEWLEPILLLTGLLNESGDTKLIRLVNGTKSPFEDVLHNNLILILRLYSELNLFPNTRTLREVKNIISKDKISSYLRGIILQYFEYFSPTETVSFLLSTERFSNPLYRLYDLLKGNKKNEILFLLIKGFASEKIRYWLTLGDFLYSFRYKHNYDYDIKSIIKKLLENDSNPVDTLLSLIIALFDPDVEVRQASLYALRRAKDKRVIAYISYILKQDSDYDIRASAAWTLGKIENRGILPSLFEAYSDKNEDVRYQIAKAIGNIGDIQVVPYLVKMIVSDIDSDVRIAALESANNLPNFILIPEMTKALIKTLGDNNVDIRQLAAEGLKKNGLPILELIQAISEQTDQGRDTIIYLLVECGDTAVDELITALSSKNIQTKISVIRALGGINTIKACNGLIKALEDENQEVRELAASRLSNNDDPKLVPYLQTLLNNKNAWIRRTGIASLRKFDAALKKESMIQGISDEDPNVRYQASIGLYGFGVEILPDLFHILRKGSNEVKEVAANAITSIGAPALPYLVKVLTEDDRDSHRFAIYALGQIACWNEAKELQILPYLREKLNDSDFRMRGAAAITLGKFKDASSIPIIVQLLSDDQEYVRISALSSLGRIGTTEVIPYIIGLLNDNNARIRAAAVFSLADTGNPETFPHVLQLINDETAIVRSAVADAISRINTNKALPYLLQLLDDKEITVRSAVLRKFQYGNNVPPEAIPNLLKILKDMPSLVWEVTFSLSKIKDSSAIPYLATALKDNNPTINSVVASVLDNMDTIHIIPLLFDLLMAKFAHDESYIIARKLENIKDVEAVPYLLEEIANRPESKWWVINMLKEIDYADSVHILGQLLINPDEDVRVVAVKALSTIRTVEALNLLVDALTDSNWDVCRAAKIALVESKDQQIIPTIILLFGDNNPIVRERAIKTIGDFGAICIPYLTPILQDENTEVRRAAVRVLGFIDDKECVPNLLNMLRSNTERVQEAVIWALGMIGDLRAFPTLIQELHHNSDKDAVLLQALRKIDGFQATPYLVEALSHPIALIRKTALYELAKIEDADLTPYLLNYLAEKNVDKDILQEIRNELDDYPSQLEIYPYPLDEHQLNRAVQGALDRINDPKAIPYLVDALQDRAVVVRVKAAEILERIGTPQVVPAVYQAIMRYGIFENSLGALQVCVARLKPPTEMDERKKWMRLLKSTARILYKSRHKHGKDIDITSALAIITSKLQTISLRYIDPSARSSPSRAMRITRSTAVFISVCVILAVMGIFTVFSDLLKDILKAQWQDPLKAWITTKPFWALAALVAASAVATGLITIFLDWLKNRKSA